MAERSLLGCLPLVGAILSRRRAGTAAVQRNATALIVTRGDLAYPEARTRARVATRHAVQRYWTRVALLIAERQGIAIGGTTADRYHEAGRTWVPPEA